MECYRDESGYPEIKVCGKNPVYAHAMLENMAGCSSEMSAATLYTYNGIITKNIWERASLCFYGISSVEMQHLNIFGQLALALGANPCYCSRQRRRMTYWNAGCNSYTMQLPVMIQKAIHGENMAIEQYYRQTKWIKDPYIVEMLKRIIMDEERHIAIFQQLYNELQCGDIRSCKP